MKKAMALLMMAVFCAACGGGSSGSSSLAVTCAPANPSPVTDVTGNWQVAITDINSNCPTPPNWITCNVTLEQADSGEVTLASTPNCSVNITVQGQTATSNEYTSISAFGGIVNGYDFYWLGNLTTSFSEEEVSYEEIDSISCDTISNFRDGSSSGVNTTTTYTLNGSSSTCTGTATVTFTQL